MGMIGSLNPYPAASSKASRVLHSIDTTAPHFTKFKAALEKLKIPFMAPVWAGDAVAHAGIPSLRYAIFMVGGSRSRVREISRVEQWAREGWKLDYVLIDKINQADEAALVSDLKEAIANRKKECLRK